MKIKYILFSIILFYASNAYSQPSPDYEKKGFRVGIFYSFDTNLVNDNVTFTNEVGYRINYNKTYFTAGINLEYYLLKNFILHSGVSYSNRSFDGTYYCNVCQYIGSSQKPIKINLRFFQIPISGRRYLYINEFGLFGELGILNQLLVDKPIQSTRLDARTYSLSGIAGVGIEYNFDNYFAAQLSVKYTHGFSDIFKSVDYSYQVLGYQLSILKAL